jgi:hypothetical protein
MIFFHPPGGGCFSASDYSSRDYTPHSREGVKMVVAVLTGILLFGGIIFLVSRGMKEKIAEEKESAESEKNDVSSE